jgi:hypothetical protein
VLVNLAEREIRSYVPEPERGKRHWPGKAEEQRCVYANRQRVRAERRWRGGPLSAETSHSLIPHLKLTAMRLPVRTPRLIAPVQNGYSPTAIPQ